MFQPPAKRDPPCGQALTATASTAFITGFRTDADRADGDVDLLTPQEDLVDDEATAAYR